MSRIDCVDLHRLAVPLKTPYRLSFGPIGHFDTIVVEIKDEHGVGGFGEATVLTGYTDETIDDSWRLAEELASSIAGLDCDDALSRIEAAAATHPFTATAFATALEMLGGSALLRVQEPTRVPLLGLLHADHEQAIAAEFNALLAQGFRTIKVKVGFDVKRDLERVRAVQKVAAGRAAIRLDANQGYSAEQGITFVRALDPMAIELFEQPCAAGDWNAHLAVARAANVPMMLDESIYGMADIERAAELGAARYIKVKLMKLVTLTGLTRAIDRIRALGMQPVLGNGVACDIGCWMEACVAARQIDNAGEMNGFLKPHAGLMRTPLHFADGAIVLRPEFVPELTVDGLARHRLGHTKVPRAVRVSTSDIA